MLAGPNDVAYYVGVDVALLWVTFDLSHISLHNCSAHPDPEELVSDDGTVKLQIFAAQYDCVDTMNGPCHSVPKDVKKLLHRLIVVDDLGMSTVDFIQGCEYENCR